MSHTPDTPKAGISDYDLHLFGQGEHRELYRLLGAQPAEREGQRGVRFAVWAPNAHSVSVVGGFNGWGGQNRDSHPMHRHDAGVWEAFVPGIGQGEMYKYEILGYDGATCLRSDPFAFHAGQYPSFASIVHDLDRYEWSDSDWMNGPRASGEANSHAGPMATYELHLGSWRRDEHGNPYDYRRLAEELVTYVSEMGYTHVEFLPPTEHPFGGSWGYQPLGIYAPTSRFGSPDDFKLLVDAFHRAGIAVVIDWVPAHFPSDDHGLARFDGTALYEHEDPRRGYHPDWNTLIFNLGRNEVSNYLLSNALFWLREYHVDALRVDAVASMLYLDYSREEGEWLPNEHGGNENLESVAFLKKMNELVHAEEPGVTTIAEESTSWPMVSAPTSAGGLGFGYKWNMGWMHDTLQYMKEDPISRAYHHDELTFSLHYAFSENFVLPLSHDEVVHGKGSLINKMPGDEWQRLANLRVYYAFMYSHPGKKLLFMGDELAQPSEWNHDSQVEWGLQEDHGHAGIQRLVRDLNTVYRGEAGLHEVDHEPEGFEWIEGDDRERSAVAFLRHARSARPEDSVVVVCNFTPVVREDYRIGVPLGGSYRETLNTDASLYGGSDVGNGGSVEAEEEPAHGRPYSLSLTLPPLGALFLKPSGISDQPPANG